MLGWVCNCVRVELVFFTVYHCTTTVKPNKVGLKNVKTKEDISYLIPIWNH